VIEVMVAKRIVPVEFHFRMGVHVGLVYCFWDAGRNGWNYAGSGINGGSRVLSAIGKDTDDVLFISAEVRQQIIAANDQTSVFRDLIANLHNRGRRNDKHGNSWRVYEVNHTAVGRLPEGLNHASISRPGASVTSMPARYAT
jgi:class 3 adenylate cyclase